MDAEVLVAGHVCLDIIPTFSASASAIEPGRLVEVGKAILATGGPVSNTGLSLHKLGVPVRLVGKVGDDLFGGAIASLFDGLQKGLGASLIVSPGESTSYTVVISPPGADRIFLHAPGCNDTFVADDLPDGLMSGVRLVHFGYPPLMENMYKNGGAELIRLMSRIKASGRLSSLDMSLPDADAESGRADWKAILGAVLPKVDFFLPSAEECLYMLDRPAYDQLKREHGAAGVAGAMRLADFRRLAEFAIDMGATVVGLKAGSRGLYVKTAVAAGLGLSEDWDRAEYMAPCFQTCVVGTTGSGDTTIAGFLMGVVRGWTLEEAMNAATAAGACCVEAPDATGGVRSWEETEARVATGWTRHAFVADEDGWRETPSGVWRRN